MCQALLSAGNFEIAYDDLVFNANTCEEPLLDHKFQNKIWRKFGFQREDPTTDFRAAGFFGVTQLTYFAKVHP